MKVALCLLTLNEIGGCKHDVPLIKKIRKSFYEIFDVDNGSTDGTVEYLKSQGVKVISKPGISYNEMHHVAISNTSADAVIFFPPKGTNSVKDSLKFQKYFDQGYDLVVASRTIKGGKNEEDKYILKPRKWLMLTLAFLSAIRWRTEGNIIWDCLHVYRGTTVKSFKKTKLAKTGQTFDFDQIVQSYKNRNKRIEFSTWEKERLTGKSHFRLIPFGTKLLRCFIKEAIKFD